MCYVIYIATDSNANLAEGAGDRMLLERWWEPVELLTLPNLWYLSREFGGCSCNFRVDGIAGVEPCFGAPEDWCPEDDDDIEATQQLYDLVSRLNAGGSEVETLCVWTGTDSENVKTLEVDLSKVGRDAFRLFENCLFRFTWKSPVIRSHLDHFGVAAVIQLTDNQLMAIIEQVMPWMQDYNWPAAKKLEPRLLQLGARLEEPIRAILRTDDEMWIIWVTQILAARNNDLKSALAPDYATLLERIRSVPIDEDWQCVMDAVLEVYEPASDGN